MIDRCPAAQTCRDVFEHLAAATLSLLDRQPSPNPSKRLKHNFPQENNRKSLVWAQTYTPPLPTTQQGPASLANLLHHPAQPPTPPASQYQQPYEVPYDDGIREGVMQGPTGEMHVVDGRGLFEMLQEVGAAGSAWEMNGQVGWNYDPSTWTGEGQGQGQGNV
jgi:hypothetical protein